MILRIHHAQITVPEGAEDETWEFYCGLLRLPEIQKPDSLAGRSGFWIEVGAQQVHVGTEPGVDRLATKAHLAYEVQHLRQWCEALARQGIKMLESIPLPGHNRFEFRDPFGSRGKFIQRSDFIQALP